MHPATKVLVLMLAVVPIRGDLSVVLHEGGSDTTLTPQLVSAGGLMLGPGYIVDVPSFLEGAETLYWNIPHAFPKGSYFKLTCPPASEQVMGLAAFGGGGGGKGGGGGHPGGGHGGGHGGDDSSDSGEEECDCTFYIVAYHCPPCSTCLSGGWSGLLADGWEGRSCGPKFHYGGDDFLQSTVVLKHDVLSGTTVNTMPSTEESVFVGVFGVPCGGELPWCEPHGQPSQPCAGPGGCLAHCIMYDEK